MASSEKNNLTGLIIVVVSVLIIIGFLVLIFKNSDGATSQPTVLNSESLDSSDSMTDHHPKTPSDNSKFASLIDKPAPDFSLKDINGNSYSVATLKGKNAVLFFNEGLMCYPACWNQITTFAKDARFKNAGAEVISIVVDAPSDWKKAIEKMPDLAAAKVIFDSDKKVSGDFGVLNLESSMHKGAFPGHTYIIIDKNGIVKFAMDDPNMAINNDRLIEELKKI